jgi:hypothetical protein
MHAIVDRAGSVDPASIRGFWAKVLPSRKLQKHVVG